MRSILRAAFVSFALHVGPGGVPAAEPSGTFGVVADIHFDPFEPATLSEDLRSTAIDDWMSRFAALGEQRASQRGSDTNHVLLVSALSAIAERMAAADFVILAGDLLSHRFGADVDISLDAPKGSGAQHSFAQKTAAFVIDALSKALPDKAILIALGNNDSDCGDYALETGGNFLAATMEVVKKAAGISHVTADFEKTYRAGGYYEVQHPTVKNAKILVVNDVLWSREYRNRCGTTGFDEARKQLEWLKSQLLEQKSRGGMVWIVHHVPWGIDAYSTVHSTADICASRVVPFLREEISAELLALLRQHADTIAASFSAHTHYDDFRLLLDNTGKPAVVDKIVPAITPIAGQNPGFQVFTYNVASGMLLDYTSYYLANLDSLSSTVPGDWREEYVFTKTFVQKRYSPESVMQLSKGLDEPSVFREVYYNKRKGVLSEKDFGAYVCAIAYLETDAYTRCHCPSPSP
jgi:sphingomyelin phosphodiesterase acid-like 3